VQGGAITVVVLLAAAYALVAEAANGGAPAVGRRRDSPRGRHVREVPQRHDGTRWPAFPLGSDQRHSCAANELDLALLAPACVELIEPDLRSPHNFCEFSQNSCSSEQPKRDCARRFISRIETRFRKRTGEPPSTVGLLPQVPARRLLVSEDRPGGLQLAR
jgi:hypothetical protein